MKGIPTTYKQIRFRSRLEAKWARFFDLLNWKWEYEPFDCDGWIPDFALIGKGRMTLVEIKPICEFDKATAGKIDRANAPHEVLLLGVAPLLHDYNPQIGWLREGCGADHFLLACVRCGKDNYVSYENRCPDGCDVKCDVCGSWDGWGSGWGDAHFGVWQPDHAKWDSDTRRYTPPREKWPIGFTHVDGRWFDRMSGTVGKYGDPTDGILERLWADALNTTQWMAKE